MIWWILRRVWQSPQKRHLNQRRSSQSHHHGVKTRRVSSCPRLTAQQELAAGIIHIPLSIHRPEQHRHTIATTTCSAITSGTPLPKKQESASVTKRRLGQIRFAHVCRKLCPHTAKAYGARRAEAAKKAAQQEAHLNMLLQAISLEHRKIMTTTMVGSPEDTPGARMSAEIQLPREKLIGLS